MVVRDSGDDPRPGRSVLEYIDPQDASELENTLDQKFAGIGIQVGLEPHSGRPQVISPIVGSPADKAGILAGDVIVEIDGEPTRNMKYSDATARIRGKIGETVRLKIERAGRRRRSSCRRSDGKSLMLNRRRETGAAQMRNGIFY